MSPRCKGFNNDPVYAVGTIELSVVFGMAHQHIQVNINFFMVQFDKVYNVMVRPRWLPCTRSRLSHTLKLSSLRRMGQQGERRSGYCTKILSAHTYIINYWG